MLAVAAAPAHAANSVPTLIHDVKTGSDTLGSKVPATPDSIQDYVQPDTQAEPSIAVNPANPQNVVTVYQEGRVADGGDATNGFATSFDGGKTWKTGELPALTTYPGQGGTQFPRASDAVVAFGPGNTVYANSLVFDPGNGNLHSGIVVNVSKDGGLHWSQPVFLQNDQLGGLNDKNWIVVDNSDAPGHHKGRVYVVWDRVATVLYDYCDHDCDQLSNWLPDFQTIPGLVFPGQGIGAYPLVMKDGSLGIVLDTLTDIGVPNGTDEPDPSSRSGEEHVFVKASGAGSTPYPAPLVFQPAINISANRSNGVAAQRASDGLPAAAVDTGSGDIYVVWDDGRFRSDQQNDAVMSTSTDGGSTWSGPKRVNPGPTGDHVDHYLVTVAAAGGEIHVSYRQRDESGKGPLFAPRIDTVYQQSRDGGKTFSDPLTINVQPSNPWYDAFSRDGSFEGDYEQTASEGGYTYVTRAQGAPAATGEPPALTANPDGSDTLVLQESGKGHQHQSVWVALVRDLAAGSSTLGLPVRHRCVDRRKFTFKLHHARRSRVVRVDVYVNGRRRVHKRGHDIKTVTLRRLPRKRFVVKVVARQSSGSTITSTRTYTGCRKSRPRNRAHHHRR